MGCGDYRASKPGSIDEGTSPPVICLPWPPITGLHRHFHCCYPLPSARPCCLSALVISSFAFFFVVSCLSALLPFVAFPMSFVSCRLRLCPAPLSPFFRNGKPEDFILIHIDKKYDETENKHYLSDLIKKFEEFRVNELKKRVVKNTFITS